MPIFARHRPETEYERHAAQSGFLADLCTPAPFGLKFISGGSGMVDILNSIVLPAFRLSDQLKRWRKAPMF